MSIEKKSDEPEKISSSLTGGVLAFPIEGPLGDERHRLTVGMTDADRAYRKQWLQDQILAESEPIEVPGYYEARYNPIRRAYMMPLNKVFTALQPRLGYDRTVYWRHITGKGLMALWFGLATVYYFKYNAHNWTSNNGWRVFQSKPMILPGEAGYGQPYTKNKPADYADFGFKNSPI